MAAPSSKPGRAAAGRLSLGAAAALLAAAAPRMQRHKYTGAVHAQRRMHDVHSTHVHGCVHTCCLWSDFVPADHCFDASLASCLKTPVCYCCANVEICASRMLLVLG